MEIKRNDNSIIKKRKINFKNIKAYDELKVKQAVEYLNNEITNSLVSNFDNITYVFEKKDKPIVNVNNFLDKNVNFKVGHFYN